jgi:SAM-dependent MidA family methyltransferase
MELVLYHPECGYYARAARRSGRAGDFFTSVDVGSVFGELLAKQIGEMFDLLNHRAHEGHTNDRDHTDHGEQSEGGMRSLGLVEAGAGNGRLAADVLSALERTNPSAYNRAALHLVDASPAARAEHRRTLGAHADRLAFSSPELPASFEGVLFANELLDAMPAHQVVMREPGLQETYVDVDPRDGALGLREGPMSTTRLQEYLEHAGVSLEPGWRAEISLRAIDWVRDAARRLARGFIILIDYGHEARELYSVTHSAGTLTSFSRHVSAGPEQAAPLVPWLQSPGERDLTVHVDFTSVRAAAEAEGCTTLGYLDQTYFVMALAADSLANRSLTERLALKTLLMPGGLGSTMKVLILGKNVGTPTLVGCSSHVRVT